MNCRQIQNQIKEARNISALPEEIRVHAVQCADCSRAVSVQRMERTLLNAVSREASQEPLNGFELRVLRRIQSDRRSASDPSAVFGRIAWRLIPALVVVVIGLSVASLTQSQVRESDLGNLETTPNSQDDMWGSGANQLVMMD